MALVDWQTGKTPLECTKHLLESEVNSDVNLRVGKNKKIIKAHKFVLSMRSAVFDRMFNGGFEESKKDPVIPDINVGAFRAMLRYCYYECLDIKDDVALSVLYAAKKYMLPLLEVAARDKLIQTLNESNVWDTYKSAISIGDTELHEACRMYFTGDVTPVREALQTEAFLNIAHQVLLDFLHINDNIPKEIQRDVKNDVGDVLEFVNYKNNYGLSISEIDLFKACVAWADAECKRQRIDPTSANKRTVLGECLFLIRFPTMLQKDLTLVYSTGILTQAEMVNLRQSQNQIPGTESQVDFPSSRRQFVITTPEASSSYNDISTVFILSEERVQLSGLWVMTQGTYKVTVKNETSEETWSMKFDTKRQGHCTTHIAEKRRVLYTLDIKPQLLDSGTCYSVTTERTECSDGEKKRLSKWVVIGELALLKGVKISQDKDRLNSIYAFTMCLV